MSKQISLNEWEQVGEIGRNAAESCATGGCQRRGGGVYKAVIMQNVLYGSQIWVFKVAHATRIKVDEMRML